jgi:molecular chaperone DnaK (HSP70)
VFYAIDFGTSNTVITRWNGATNRAENREIIGVIPTNSRQSPLIPSLLYIKSANPLQVIAGQAVLLIRV